MGSFVTLACRLRRLAPFALGAVLSVAGCDCSGGTPAIFIIQPEAGASLTLADDLDGDPTNGIQIDVVANTLLLDGGQPMELRINGVVVATSTVHGGTNRVTFSAVTLPEGMLDLLVCTPDCIVQSNQVRVQVTLECPSIDFIAPVFPAMDDVLVLGPDDDVDGEPCGPSFAVDFQIATSAGHGSPIRLEVNGNTAATGTVEGTLVSFRGVVLDRRGMDDPNTIRAVVETRDGVECGASYPVPVLVDCQGVSCVITAPQAVGGYLGTAHDEDGDPTNGLQTQGQVTTGIQAVGEQVQFLTNGIPRATATVLAVGGEGVATLPLELQEGTHTAQAICRDAVGNVTHSALLQWIVDLTPCDVTLDRIAGMDATLPPLQRVVTPDHDLDEEQAGTQVELEGSVAGNNCQTVRVGVCDPSAPNLDGATFTSLTPPGAFVRIVSLGSSPTQHVCAQVRDAAGNLSVLDPLEVQFASDAPAVQIRSPLTGDRVNADGGMFEYEGESRDYHVDLNPGTTRCEAAFEVLCADTRGTVRLIHQAAGGDAVMAAPVACEPAAGLPGGFAGVARFGSVALPTLSGAPFSVVAEHRVGTVTPGVSEPIVLRADCARPQLTLLIPSSCPAVFDPNGGELAFTIRASTSAQDVQDPATLRVFEAPVGDGDTPILTLTQSFEVVSITNRRVTYNNVPFASAGDYFFDVCASDAMANRGCVGCDATVGDLPTLSILEPLPGEIFGAEGDCAPGLAGFQLQVTATTDAPNGSAAVIQTGEPGHPQGATFMTTVVGGTIAGCVDAPQGKDVPIQVRVTHPDSGLTARRTVFVHIDSNPPTDAIDDFALVVPQPSLPRHTRRFQWTAVSNGNEGALERYEVRCGASPIASEAAWNTAKVHRLEPTVTPAAPGVVQAGNVTGFPPGSTVHCTLRGADVAGALTPLGNSVEVVTSALRSFTIAAPGTSFLGWDVQGVGDVNGDGVGDLLIAGRGEAYLYFGRGAATVDGATVAPDVILRGDFAEEFGRVIAALGDVNGDGRPDFAVSGWQVGGKGAVYIFHGRSAAEPWETVIEVTGGGCQASVCLLIDDGVVGSGPDENANFGRSMAALGDFNGDGIGDIAIGAPGTNSNVGRVYVFTGGQFTPGQTVRVLQDPVNGWALVPEASVDRRFGWEMAGLGRAVGGDPLTDLAFSATGTSGGPFGALYIFRGRVLGDPGLQLLDMPSAIATGSVIEVQRAATGGSYGFKVANVGDLDGDGYTEMAVRHFGLERVILFRGGLAGYSTGNMREILNDSASPTNDQFGLYIAAGMVPGLRPRADVNGDGLSDVFVGSAQNATPPGVGQVFLGQPALSATRNRSTADSTLAPPAGTGSAIRSAGYAGDLNGDGALDMAVGDPQVGSNRGLVVVYY
jgi:hypothetical protein